VITDRMIAEVDDTTA